MARVLIVDWDVHHGNGTQHMFYDDPSVLFFSTHQYPYYPGTGAAGDIGTAAGTGFTVNLPLAAGATDADFERVFAEIAYPVLRQFAPELILVSAGFDAHADDPLGGMRISEQGFRELARRCRGLSDRLAVVLEGGYNLETLPSLVDAALDGFTG